MDECTIEPTTPTALKTFHFAGVRSMNIAYELNLHLGYLTNKQIAPNISNSDCFEFDQPNMNSIIKLIDTNTSKYFQDIIKHSNICSDDSKNAIDNKINKLIIFSETKVNENNKQLFEVIIVNHGEESINNDSDQYIKCLLYPPPTVYRYSPPK